jgi:hypothetical protein
MLDDSPQRVTVSSNEDLLALLNARLDLGLVVGEDALEGELEGLATGGRDVVRAAPDVDLLLAELDAG